MAFGDISGSNPGVSPGLPAAEASGTMVLMLVAVMSAARHRLDGVILMLRLMMRRLRTVMSCIVAAHMEVRHRMGHRPSGLAMTAAIGARMLRRSPAVAAMNAARAAAMRGCGLLAAMMVVMGAP